jgi:NitT/TauT family transport system substrate-binding protein
MRRKIIPWLSLTMLFCLVLFACSPNEEGRAPEPSRSLTRATLQLQWVTQAQFAGYYVALDKGWYRDEGIEMTIKPGGPDTIPVDLVSAGTSDFGTALLTDLAVEIGKGKQVISIGQIQQENGLLLIAKKDSGINQPKDFLGKRVGVWMGSWEAQFNALLAKEGLNANDVNLIPQGWSMKPFLRGELDVASAMIYNEYHVVLESGIKPEELNIIDYADYGLDFPGDVLFTSRQVLKKNPSLCRRMLRASMKGWRYAIEHPKETVDIVLKFDKSGIQTKQHQLSMMKEITKLVQVTGRVLGHTDEGTVKRMIDLLVHYKLLKTPIAYRDIFAAEILESIHKNKKENFK